MSKAAFVAKLAAMRVLVDGNAPRIYEPDNFKRAIESADTPARVFQPAMDGDTHEAASISLGRGTRVDWKVRDLLLYKPVEEGMGFQQPVTGRRHPVDGDG